MSIFECVYTDKIHQKQNKKWRDGSVRIFGDKVTLSDEDGKDLCSTAIKSSRIFEGEELILASAFLVQIGQFKGTKNFPSESQHGNSLDAHSVTLKKPILGSNGGLRPAISSKRFPKKNTAQCSVMSSKMIDSLIAQGRPVDQYMKGLFSGFQTSPHLPSAQSQVPVPQTMTPCQSLLEEVNYPDTSEQENVTIRQKPAVTPLHSKLAQTREPLRALDSKPFQLPTQTRDYTLSHAMDFHHTTQIIEFEQREQAMMAMLNEERRRREELEALVKQLLQGQAASTTMAAFGDSQQNTSLLSPHTNTAQFGDSQQYSSQFSTRTDLAQFNDSPPKSAQLVSRTNMTAFDDSQQNSSQIVPSSSSSQNLHSSANTAMCEDWSHNPFKDLELSPVARSTTRPVCSFDFLTNTNCANTDQQPRPRRESEESTEEQVFSQPEYSTPLERQAEHSKKEESVIVFRSTTDSTEVNLKTTEKQQHNLKRQICSPFGDDVPSMVFFPEKMDVAKPTESEEDLPFTKSFNIRSAYSSSISVSVTQEKSSDAASDSYFHSPSIAPEPPSLLEPDIKVSSTEACSAATEAPGKQLPVSSTLQRFSQMSSLGFSQKKRKGFQVPQQKPDLEGTEEGGALGTQFSGPMPLEFLNRAVACGTKSFIPARHSGLPNSFPSTDLYCKTFLLAIGEELQLQIAGIAERFAKANLGINQKEEQSVNMKVNKFKKVHSQVKDDGWWHSFYHQRGLSFYPSIKLICTQTKKEKDKKFFERKRGDGFSLSCEDKATDKEGEVVEDRRYFLKIDQFSTYKEKSTEYQKGDVWCISSSGKFIHDRKTNPSEELFFVRSLWHAPSPQEGMLQVALLSGPSSKVDKDCSFTCTGKAIRCLNNMTFFAFAELLLKKNIVDTDFTCIPGKDLQSFPLMKTILNGQIDDQSKPAEGDEDEPPLKKRTMPKFGVPLSKTSVGKHKKDLFKVHLTRVQLDSILKEVLAQFQLNNQQSVVLEQCISWFKPVNDDQPVSSTHPIVLVHGVFGSGKSYTLVALCVLIDRIMEADKSERETIGARQRKADEDVKILMSGATNMAIDRVLKGLIEEKFENIARVGSLLNIDKALLAYVVHQSTAQSSKDYVKKQLQAMLQETEDSGLEGTALAKHLEELDSPLFEKLQQNRLKNARVTGVTCASCNVQLLSLCTYAIVILDECSQMIEPLSMLPLVTAQAQKAVLVGDPMQLPPPLAFSEKNVEAQNCTWEENDIKLTNEDSLEKTLFVRLSKIGLKPVLLGRQYRCHPEIARLANILFYSGRLTNGIVEQNRPALVKGLPPIALVDTEEGQETKGYGDSFTNRLEAEVVIEIVDKLLRKGVQPAQIGIICLYKGQGRAIRDKLSCLQDAAAPVQVMGKLKKVIHKEEDADELENQRSAIQVSTVDAFQGAEKDIIIVSCCRTDKLGFIASPHRLNVTITRAKNHLIIVGRYKAIKKNNLWQAIGDHVEKSGRLVTDASELFQQMNRSVSKCEFVM